MILSKTKADEQYFVRLESENGRWEMGLHQVLFGVRVQGGLKGEPFLAFDYCAGADIDFQWRLLSTMMLILGTFDESLEPYELQRVLPTFVRKPINQDPCWEKLQKLRDSRLQQE